MRAINPAVIPRNHLVEAAIQAATRHNDLAPFHELVEVLACPFVEPAAGVRYLAPPSDAERVAETFCGT